MEDYLDGSQAVEQNTKTPTFLKVLCILTFVGAGYGVLSALYSILSFDSGIEQLKISGKVMESRPNPFSSDFAKLIDVTKEWGMLTNVLSLVGNIMCVLGAFFMIKMKKIGFFLHLPGEIIALVGIFILAGAMGFGGGIMTLSVTITAFGSALFYLAFIIMYATNYKHLK